MFLLSKFLILLKFLFAIREFNFPIKNEVLLVDYLTGKKLVKYLKNFTILYTRFEKTNFLIILVSLKDFLLKKNKLNFTKIYYINFIKKVDPKILITSDDFDSNIWELKKFFPKIKIIIIQNNARYGWSFTNNFPRKYKKKKSEIDYVLLYGDVYKKLYSKIFKSKFINIGSINNNKIPITANNNKKSLVFISQFKNWKTDDYSLDNKNKKINLYDSYLKTDKVLLNECCRFCKKYNKKLFILGRNKNSKDIDMEIEYYKKISNLRVINFLKQNNDNNAYKISNKYSHFVSVDSSLAYEFLSKNKRVGYMNIRYQISKFHRGEHHRYGWPGNFKIKGLFWTNTSSHKEINRVLKNLYFTSSKDWMIAKKRYVEPIINFDYRNKRLQNLLSKLLSN